MNVRFFVDVGGSYVIDRVDKIYDCGAIRVDHYKYDAHPSDVYAVDDDTGILLWSRDPTLMALHNLLEEE
jgi:outer membrane protein assembly factor BamB